MKGRIVPINQRDLALFVRIAREELQTIEVRRANTATERASRRWRAFQRAEKRRARAGFVIRKDGIVCRRKRPRKG